MKIIMKIKIIIILLLLYSFRLNEDFCVNGKVVKIEYGKDGYEATIYANDKKEYLAVVSISNMANSKEYKLLNIGDSVKICGNDTFSLSGTLHILAKHITLEK